MRPLAVLASGMVTSVGPTAPASCAAIRAAVRGIADTRFMDRGGEWIRGGAVPLDTPVRGREKLLELAVSAIGECLPPGKVPVLLCLPEAERPGRLDGLDESLLWELAKRLKADFHEHSMVFADGRVAGAQALRRAEQLVHESKHPRVVVAGVDTFLVGPTLAAYEKRERLMTSRNSDGFLPGEAAAAVALGPAESGALLCVGIGFGTEKAFGGSGEPLRGDGLLEAARAALADAGTTFDAIDYRISDACGEQYGMKEAALVVGRGLRQRKTTFPIWQPAECLGEVGAATVPVALAVALAAARKDYAPGPGVLCHVSGDDGARAAIVLRKEGGA
ncbi:MAG: hypothetical protein HYY17_06760 [Planctomycetes bacterium]|nr:hypothetical protein [Planctomycetota bacterium]